MPFINVMELSSHHAKRLVMLSPISIDMLNYYLSIIIDIPVDY